MGVMRYQNKLISIVSRYDTIRSIYRYWNDIFDRSTPLAKLTKKSLNTYRFVFCQVTFHGTLIFAHSDARAIWYQSPPYVSHIQVRCPYLSGRDYPMFTVCTCNEAPPHWRSHHQAVVKTVMLKFVEVKGLKCTEITTSKKVISFYGQKIVEAPPKRAYTLPR